MKHTTRGYLAGCAGAVALNMATYLDMALTGRPESRTPAETVRRLLEAVGCDEGAVPDEKADDALKHRRAAVGAMLGLKIGTWTGAVAGLAWPALRRLPPPLRAVAVGAAAMAAADWPIAKLGVSDPRTWTKADWLRDALPHLAYGITTAAVLDLFDRVGDGRPTQPRPTFEP